MITIKDCRMFPLIQYINTYMGCLTKKVLPKNLQTRFELCNLLKKMI